MDDLDKSSSTEIPKHVQQSIDELEASAIAWLQFKEQLQGFTWQKGPHFDSDESDVRIKSWLDILDLAEVAGDLNPAVLFLLCSMAVERIHSQRSYAGVYKKDLEDIESQIEVIEKREGLDEFEYWLIGEGPEDWNQLNNQYDLILDVKFEETLREFGLEDMAELYLSDREAYEASREQGRLIVFSKKPDLDKLSYVQKYFESESDACTKSGAYLAASVMIGAAIETALLFACMNNPNATMAARDKLSKKLRPKGTDPKRWSLKNLIDIAFVAGWLPDSKIDGSVFDPKYLTSMIREHRNSVHPSRHLLPSGLKSFQHAYNESEQHMCYLNGVWQDLMRDSMVLDFLLNKDARMVCIPLL